jgi:hypothetical protein
LSMRRIVVGDRQGVRRGGLKPSQA